MRNPVLFAVTFLSVAFFVNARANTSEPAIAVLNFDNLTGPSSSRVFPAVYFEQDQLVGTDSEANLSKSNKTHHFESKDRAIFERQVNTLVEYSPGAWALPPRAGRVASETVSAAINQLGFCDILNETQSADVQGKESAFFNPFLYGVSNEDLADFFAAKGVRFLVMGSISEYRVDIRQAKAYGIERTNFITTLIVDLHVLDTQSRSVVYQDMVNGRVVTSVPEAVSVITDVYNWEPILREALVQAVPNLLDALKQRMGARVVVPATTPVPPSAPAPVVAVQAPASVPATRQPVAINIDSKPDGADIMVDGLYKGTTPAAIEVMPGLREVAIEHPGHERWERTIDAQEGFAAKPALTAYEEPESLVELVGSANEPTGIKSIQVEVETQE